MGPVTSSGPGPGVFNGGMASVAPQERSTSQKRALAAVLHDAEGFRSAQELHRELLDRGERIGRTTVYNQLRDMVAAGLLDVLPGDDGETRYRRCTPEHHHHLVCRRCGRTVEVEEPQVERWAEDVAGRHGYAEVSHTLEVFGICGDCQARRDPGRAVGDA